MKKKINLYVLGTPRVTIEEGGKEADIDLAGDDNKLLALVIYILMERKKQPRKELSKMFWGTEANHRETQKKRVQGLKKLLVRKGFREYFKLERNYVSLYEDVVCYIDAIEFETKLDNISANEQVETLENIEALYRGEFCAGLDVRNLPKGFGEETDWEYWKTERVLYYENRYKYLLFELVKYLAGTQKALGYTRRIFDDNDYALWDSSRQKVFFEKHIELLLADGDNDAVLAAYKATQDAEIKLTDRTKDICEEISADKGIDIAQRMLEEFEGKLERKPRREGLIGWKSKEIDALVSRVYEERILVLTGPLGVGKTELARTIAFNIQEKGWLENGVIDVYIENNEIGGGNEAIGEIFRNIDRILMSSLKSVETSWFEHVCNRLHDKALLSGKRKEMR
ncbi:hypothetical protein KFU94_01510 [Chloroflexi bacterium TSY]|nr:hypothetical protein [Chloroflexi bacterium TSY]